MRRILISVALLVMIGLPALAGAQEYPERWILGYQQTIVEKEGADEFIALIKKAGELGYTHVIYDEVYNQMMWAMPPSFFENAERVKAAAKEAGVIIVPGIFNVGYSWRVIWNDSNLAAGHPARNVPFLVNGAHATPDPSVVPVVLNPGLEPQPDTETTAWTPSEGAEVSISYDADVTHSGAASLKMSDFDKLPMVEGRRRPQKASCQVKQTMAVEPFKYYRLTIWRKTESLKASGSSVNIAATDGSRRLCYTNFEIDPEADWEDFVTPDSDWKEFQLTFNTFESTSIDITVGVDSPTSGALWWDDINIEPAGLANLLRGDTKPFVVTSSDGTIEYKEGRDYIYAVDPLTGKAPMPAWLSYVQPGGSYDIYHQGPDLRLTPESAIKDGDTILVSYFHPHIVYGHQVVGSLTDPKIFEIFEKQMQWNVKVWDAPVYFMGYDEIRGGGWEKQPGGADYKVARLLADHITKAYAIGKKYAPDATFYVWSDMFDPFHNARKREGQNGYYLCNGDFEGSWEGLNPDIRIMKWAGGGRPCLEFFTGRGHKMVISGGSPRAVESWKKDAEGIPGVVGFMYTNWQGSFDGLEGYIQAIDAPLPPAEEPPAAE